MIDCFRFLDVATRKEFKWQRSACTQPNEIDDPHLAETLARETFAWVLDSNRGITYLANCFFFGLYGSSRPAPPSACKTYFQRSSKWSSIFFVRHVIELLRCLSITDTSRKRKNYLNSTCVSLNRARVELNVRRTGNARIRHANVPRFQRIRYTAVQRIFPWTTPFWTYAFQLLIIWQRQKIKSIWHGSTHCAQDLRYDFGVKMRNYGRSIEETTVYC